MITYRNILFDFGYPLFNPNYKTIIENKILRHFWLREIGFETIGAFKFHLQRTMTERMPLINRYYESLNLDFDPLTDTKLKTVSDGTVTANGTKTGQITFTGDRATVYKPDNQTETTTSTHGNSDGTDTDTGDYQDTVTHNTSNKETLNTTVSTVYGKTNITNTGDSDTPQGKLSDVKEDRYLTTYEHRSSTDGGTDNTKTTGNNTTKLTGTDVTSGNHSDTLHKIEHHTDEGHTLAKNTGTDKTTNTIVDLTDSSDKTNSTENSETNVNVTGKSPGKSFSQLLMEYRDTFIDPDLMVIDALEPLFMQLWY